MSYILKHFDSMIQLRCVFQIKIRDICIILGYLKLVWSESKTFIKDVIKYNHFRVTDPLWAESIGHWWIPHTKAELWSFLWLRLNKLLSKQSRRQWFETPSRSLWRHCNFTNKPSNIVQVWHIFDLYKHQHQSFRNPEYFIVVSPSFVKI